MISETVLAGALQLVLNPAIYAYIALGLVLGTIVGALPGLTTVLAMSLLLPISFFLDPLLGIPFLIGVYKGGIYGGSIPAVLVGIPGTGASIPTTFEGPALTRQGKGRKGLEMSLYSSIFGDLSSDVVTFLLLAPVAAVALLIGPPEQFAVIVFSLVLLSVASGGSPVKGMLMTGLGLLLATVGQEPINGLDRLTLGVYELSGGIGLVPMMLGLFAVSEVLLNLENRTRSLVSDKVDLKRIGERLRWSELWASRRTLVRSTFIGTMLGIIPGVGQVIAAFLGYNAARKASKTPENYGKGELDGIAGSEAANNAVNGPTLIPLLTLGIPGDKVTAILLGAFVAQGLSPGPRMIETQGELVYAILLTMIIANLMLLVVGYLFMGWFARLATIGKSSLLPMILMFALLGTYIARSNEFDLSVMLVFGVVGYLLRKFDFDLAPLVIAFILCPVLEKTLGQSIIMSRGALGEFLFLDRPIAGVFLVLTVLMLCARKAIVGPVSRRFRKLVGVSNMP